MDIDTNLVGWFGFYKDSKQVILGLGGGSCIQYSLHFHSFIYPHKSVIPTLIHTNESNWISN